MKFSKLKAFLIMASFSFTLATLIEISPLFDAAQAAPGGQGMGVGGGPTCPPACPPNPANCDANLVITETQALSFGDFTAAAGGGGGTVVVDPGGLRSSPSPGIVLLASNPGSAATFSMTTAPYNCTGRALVTVSAVSPSGLTGPGPSMALDTFVMIPAAGGTFDAAVPMQLGATLHVADGQTPGAYNGTYTLTVTFQ